jgi:hypothetical protein
LAGAIGRNSLATKGCDLLPRKAPSVLDPMKRSAASRDGGGFFGGVMDLVRLRNTSGKPTVKALREPIFH